MENYIARKDHLNFRNDKSDVNYSKLVSTLKNQKWSDKIKKAFGFGKPIFDLASKTILLK